MTTPDLLAGDLRIETTAAEFLAGAGEVFATFGAPRQDSGNVSYGVRVGAKRYFVKTAGDPADPEPFLDFQARVALLRNAVEVAESCPHPAVPKLHGVIESPSGPLLVYDWLDGELLGVPAAVREDPGCSYQRFRALPGADIEACLDVIYDLHERLTGSGWIALDFYDGCLVYDFDAKRLGIVDLDMYRRGPFVNDMGRLFGSTRFMAPEEFEKGALIDQATTVFAMGRTAALFLGDGTLGRAAFRGSDAQHDVVVRACDPDRRRRFASMAEFHDAWTSAGRP